MTPLSYLWRSTKLFARTACGILLFLSVYALYDFLLGGRRLGLKNVAAFPSTISFDKPIKCPMKTNTFYYYYFHSFIRV